MKPWPWCPARPATQLQSSGLCKTESRPPGGGGRHEQPLKNVPVPASEDQLSSPSLFPRCVVPPPPTPRPRPPFPRPVRWPRPAADTAPGAAADGRSLRAAGTSRPSSSRTLAGRAQDVVAPERGPAPTGAPTAPALCPSPGNETPPSPGFLPVSRPAQGSRRGSWSSNAGQPAESLTMPGPQHPAGPASVGSPGTPGT